jgi:anti-sigma B factor antagonist
MFEIKLGEEGIVHLSGRLDASQVAKAEDVLKELERPVILDLAELEYLSSAGIGLLVHTYKQLHNAGHSLQLRNLTPRIRNIFRYAGLEKLFALE